MPNDLITLEAVDVDGAIRETADAVGATRSDFLKRGGIAGAGFLASGVLFSGLVSPAEAAISTKNRSKKNDIKILNYALTLEYLEAAFYQGAVDNGSINADRQLAIFADTVRRHELSHVKTLRGVLGSKAVKRPSFDFGDTISNATKFRGTAQILEDTGVAAYAGQGPNLLQRPLVRAALGIHSVEARHAAWIRFINSSGGLEGGEKASPAPNIIDSPKSEKTVLKAVTATGFIKG